MPHVKEVTARYESQTFKSSADIRESTNAGELLATRRWDVHASALPSGLVIERRQLSDAVWSAAMDKASKICNGRTGEPFSRLEAEGFAWCELGDTDLQDSLVDLSSPRKALDTRPN